MLSRVSTNDFCPPLFAAESGCMCMNRLREPVRVESGTLVCATGPAYPCYCSFVSCLERAERPVRPSLLCRELPM